VVVDLNGEPILLTYGLGTLGDILKAMDPRRTFVAAGSVALANEILRALRST